MNNTVHTCVCGHICIRVPITYAYHTCVHLLVHTCMFVKIINMYIYQISNKLIIMYDEQLVKVQTVRITYDFMNKSKVLCMTCNGLRLSKCVGKEGCCVQSGVGSESLLFVMKPASNDQNQWVNFCVVPYTTHVSVCI